MAMSIVHRITGVALYFGTLLLVWWLLATASGPPAYATFQGFIGSWFGRLILFGYTFALLHHLTGRPAPPRVGSRLRLRPERARVADARGADRLGVADDRRLDHCVRRGRPAMSSSKQSIRTPLARVRGLGSARAGTGDFWQQRLTAIAMVLLIVPAIVIVMMIGRNHAGAQQILGSTPVAIVLILFTLTSVWHMKIGMQVVIEDYVHDERLKLDLDHRQQLLLRGRRAGCDLRPSETVLRSLISWPRETARLTSTAAHTRSKITPMTSWWSAPAARACAPRSAAARRACARPASPRSSRRVRTRSRRKAASRPRSATCTRTTGAGTCTTPSRGRTGSATRTRSSTWSSTRRTRSTSSSTGACRSRAPKTAGSTSVRSAA